MTALKKQTDDLFAEIQKLKTEGSGDVPSKDCVPVSFWVPRDYHKKFHEAQDITDKKFGKAFKKYLMLAIDAAVE